MSAKARFRLAATLYARPYLIPAARVPSGFFHIPNFRRVGTRREIHIHGLLGFRPIINSTGHNVSDKAPSVGAQRRRGECAAFWSCAAPWRPAIKPSGGETPHKPSIHP